MRLFVAVDISDETRGQLKTVRDQLDAWLAHAPNPPRVRWVAPSMAHVTMCFIGEVATDGIDAIGAALAAVRWSPFEVRFGSFGAFPHPRSPRALWIGATEGGDQLARVASAVNQRLGPIVGLEEPRLLTPHVTVGRVKEPGRGVDWPGALARVQAGVTTSPVDHLTLYQSRTSRDGAIYTAVSRFPFGA